MATLPTNCQAVDIAPYPTPAVPCPNVATTRRGRFLVCRTHDVDVQLDVDER